MSDYLPTGCPLDELFGDGLRTRTLTQVYGPPGSGKTNIALHALVNCIRAGKKAAFIDTEGSFCRQRLAQIAGSDYDRVLKNTTLFEPGSFEEQARAITKLSELDGASLIIVDSMVYHYRLELDRDEPQECAHRLGQQLAALLNLARTKNVAVLLTNQVYTNIESGTIEPIGGETFKYGSKIIIALHKGPERVARLVKHKFKPEGQMTRFEITDRGIE